MESELGVFEPIPSFGGKHTSEKLEIVARYTKAYTTALKRQPFKLVYVDAFAGAGYFRPKVELSKPSNQLSFEAFQDEGVERLIEGSARRALDVIPRFDKYVFVETDPRYVQELKKLKFDFEDISDAIEVIEGDANSYLKIMCSKEVWTKWRALVFLDPFGMEVEWSTLEAIAGTKAIDVWYLFPAGTGILRLLKKDGAISEANQASLDKVLGCREWRSAFYEVASQGSLFTHDNELVRSADYNTVERFFVDRLKTIFSGVADKPYRLFNSKGVWLYSMCFAAGNPRGAKIALKIANYILEEKPWQRVQVSNGLK